MVLAARVEGLAELAKGGATVSPVEGTLELREGGRGVGSAQEEQQVGLALAHVDSVSPEGWHVIYTVSNHWRESGPNGHETAQIESNPCIQTLEMRQYA